MGLSALLTAGSAGPVNVPYPLSPDEAARDFLRAVDEGKPRSWLGGIVSGKGPFLAAGVLHGKTRTPAGATVLMVRLPSDEIALVRSDDSLPELAIGQRGYLLVDFAGPDGPTMGQLQGVVLACDLGPKAESLDVMLGLSPQAGSLTPTSAPPVTPLAPASIARQPVPGTLSAPPTTSPRPVQPSLPPPQPPAAPPLDPGSPVCLAPLNPGVLSPSTSAPRAPTALGAFAEVPGALVGPQPLGDEDARRIEFWKNWIAGYNKARTEAECEAIARWVIYYSGLHGVDHRLIFAVMKYESNFDPGCKSHAGAMGLMQLMPETCKDLGVDPWVVEENIRGGIEELTGYLDQYAGRPSFEQCALALACYNAGPGRVKRAGGIPNITETKNYVRRVTQMFDELVKSGAP